MKQKELAVGAACGLAVGVAVGVVATLLLTPASGDETRRRLLYERDHAAEVTRRQLRRAMARLRRDLPEEEVEVEEGEGAFIGA
jgi:gas vesicle protein